MYVSISIISFRHHLIRYLNHLLLLLLLRCKILQRNIHLLVHHRIISNYLLYLSHKLYLLGSFSMVPMGNMFYQIFATLGNILDSPFFMNLEFNLDSLWFNFLLYFNNFIISYSGVIFLEISPLSHINIDEDGWFCAFYL